jgi:hypothetical protein
MQKLTNAQNAVLKDLHRMSRKKGFVYAADCEHFDGRTLRSLRDRGLIEYQDARYIMKGV